MSPDIKTTIAKREQKVSEDNCVRDCNYGIPGAG